MATKFKIGDLVWAKMKGFPAWPGKVIEPKSNVKKPADRKRKQFVFFFGSENYAWIPEEAVHRYIDHKDQFESISRVPRGFKEALVAIEDALLANPDQAVKTKDLPTIDDELAQIFPSSKDDKANQKDYSRRGKKRSESSDSAGSTPRGSRLSAVGTVNSTRSSKKGDPTPRARSDKKKDSRTSLTKPLKKRALSPASSTPPPPKKGKALVKHMTSDSGLEPKSMVTTSESRAMQREVDEYACRDPFLDPDYSPALAAPAPPKNVIATPMKIGFLGLGIMGTGMVNNLLISGHEVTVWNRTPSKCREFVKEGALKANSPAEVVQTCDITFSCVSDPAALKDLVFGNCGVLQGIEQGKAFVDMSTVDVETIQDINEAVTARGGRFLEAPVIGSRQPSVDGSLVVLAAGDRSLYDDCYSCFEAMGRKTYYLGEVGSATKMKLVTTMLMGTVLAGLSESLALAEKVGLDQDDVMSILQMSPVSCSYIKEKGNAMLSSHYNDPHCKLQVYQKDLRLAVNMSDSVDQPLHVGSAVNELFKKAKAKGYGEHDTAAVYRAAAL